MRLKVYKGKWWGVGVVGFRCPGCGDEHIIYTDASNPSPNKERSVWGFNGNFERPTFTPSILYKKGKFVNGVTAKEIDYYEQSGMESIICHSYITDGVISILTDSTKNPGQKFELPFVLSNKRKL